LLAAAVNISGLKIASQSNNNVVALLNTTNPSNGTIGNVAIASSSSATVTTGMSGGGTGLPLLLTKLCAALTAASLFGRRNDLPEEVKASIQWADMWLEKFDRGEVQIPQIDRSTFPQLQDSYWVNGQSSFDWIFGTAPSPTGPTSANGQAIPPNTY
jgi:hypothetical protein